jgi:hypothetical protein
MKALILAALLAAFSLPASAQSNCAPVAALAEYLAEKYREAPVASGVTEKGLLAQVYASPEGTWTLVVIRPDSIGCIALMGEGWQQATPRAPGKDA